MDMKKPLRIFLILAIFVPIAAFGAQNISKTAAESGYPAIAVNREGVILAIWAEQGDESGILWYNVFKDGNWAGSKNANIVRPGQVAWSPQLDVDSEGNFHAAWGDGRGSLNREIFHAVYDPDTNKWSDSEMIWLSPANSAWQKIDLDGDRIFIVWHHQNTGIYTGHDIIMQSKLISDDMWPVAYERLVWTANDLSTHPAFKVLNDKVHVVYMEGIGDSGPWRLFFKEAKRGSSWQNVPKFEVVGAGYRPELEVDDAGDVHIVYAVKNGNFMYRSRIKGEWKAHQSISSGFSPQQFGDLRYKNNVLVGTWMQHDDSGHSIYYAKKILGGTWEKPVQVEPGSDALYPRVWIDDNGYAHFVWRDHGNVWYEKIAVPPSDPFIQLNPQSLSFIVEGKNPDPQISIVKNIGEDSLTFTISPKDDWINVAPLDGTLSQDEEQEIQVTVDAFDLDEGIYTGTIEVSSKEALNSPQTLTVNLDVLAPPIYPPMNFTGEVLENKALFYREYMHSFTWEKNPQNRNIEKYILYEIEGVNTILLEEFSSSTFEYTRRHIQKNKTYTYELWAVDDKGRTGNEPAKLTIGGTSPNLEKEKSDKSTSIKEFVVK